jgi:deglycase
MPGETPVRGAVAILVENDYQDQEVWVPLYRLREEGYGVTVVGPRAGTYASKHGYPIDAEITSAEAAGRDWSGVVIPGGWAPDRLRQDQGTLDLVRALDRRRAVIACICHGGWVLASAGIVRGRRLTSYRAIRDDLVNAGAEWIDREVVRDGHLVTARKPDDLPAFCREMLAALRGA